MYLCGTSGNAIFNENFQVHSRVKYELATDVLALQIPLQNTSCRLRAPCCFSLSCKDCSLSRRSANCMSELGSLDQGQRWFVTENWGPSLFLSLYKIKIETERGRGESHCLCPGAFGKPRGFAGSLSEPTFPAASPSPPGFPGFSERSRDRSKSLPRD